MKSAVRNDARYSALPDSQDCASPKKPSSQGVAFFVYTQGGGTGIPNPSTQSVRVNVRNRASNTQMGRHTSLVRVSCQGVIVLGVRHLETPVSRQTAGESPDGRTVLTRYVQRRRLHLKYRALPCLASRSVEKSNRTRL